MNLMYWKPSDGRARGLVVLTEDDQPSHIVVWPEDEMLHEDRAACLSIGDRWMPFYIHVSGTKPYEPTLEQYALRDDEAKFVLAQMPNLNEPAQWKWRSDRQDPRLVGAR